MLEVQVPKDVEKIESPFLFKLTKNQCVGIIIAVILGIPVYFLLKNVFGLRLDISLMLAMFCMIPGMLWMQNQGDIAMAKKISLSLQYLIRPKMRKYRSEVLFKKEKQKQLEREVIQIVEKANNTKKTNSNTKPKQRSKKASNNRKKVKSNKKTSKNTTTKIL